MSEPSSSTNPLPAASADGGDAQAISKKGAKKAEAKAKKEAEKARRAAERLAAEAAKGGSGGAGAGGEDLAKDNYGKYSKAARSAAERVNLRALGTEHVGQTVRVRGAVQNSRMQGAKMAFVELREERWWSVQCVIAASPEGAPVSRQMVKWVGSINPESFVEVEAVVSKAPEPIKSCYVTDYELHVTKCFVLAPAPAVLGMTLAAASKPVSSFDDEEPSAEAEAVAAAERGVHDLSVAGGGDASKIPSATMLTHLNNIVIHKRAPIQQAIADVRQKVKHLFREYLDAHGFNEFEPPSLIAAASEGGANVFSLKYFEKDAFLAQSPQFYKQYEIGGMRSRVYCIGPVFRAENSNTPRHMTEVSNPS